MDMMIEEAQARVTAVNTSCALLMAKLQLNLDQAKQETTALQQRYDRREECINALVMKHRQRLNRKVEETIATRWKEWSAQAVKLHIFRDDAKNRKKVGKGFYKLDDTCVQMVREDLTEDFHVLADAHTKAISTLFWVR